MAVMSFNLLVSLLALGALAQGQHALASQSEFAIDSTRREIRSTDKPNWNEVVDQLIEQLKQQLHQQGLDEVPLPPLKEEFERRFIITVRGSLEANGGHVSNMSSVRRVGDVKTEETNPLTITTLLRFDHLSIHYEHFTARVLGLNPQGQLNATVGDNAFLLTVSLKSDENGCRLVYRDVQVMELSGIDVKISGLSVLNNLASVIANRAAKKTRQTIAVSLERLLHTQLGDIFNNTAVDCSS